MRRAASWESGGGGENQVQCDRARAFDDYKTDDADVDDD